MTIGSTTYASQEAFETGADQLIEIIRCHPLVLHPDMGMKLSVSTGGIAGLTQVAITRFAMGRTFTNTYVVNALPNQPNQLGEGITYIGADLRLSVNFTATLPNGGSTGALKMKDHPSEKLSCSLVMQNPQVNYTY